MTTATAPADPATRTASAHPGRAASRARKALLHVVLLLGGLAMVFPFLWMLWSPRSSRCRSCSTTR